MVEPLTDTEIADAWDDLGTIEIADDLATTQQAAAPAPPDTPPGPSYGEIPDEPPAHARKKRRTKTTSEPKTAAKPLRVTAGVRADITAKIAMPLEIGGHIWSARDPLCGGVFLQQRPAIADALADIVCDSADLVAFFTGPGGAFMKYLNLAAALWPVVEVIGAHHVYHSVEIAPEEEADATQPAYAA